MYVRTYLMILGCGGALIAGACFPTIDYGSSDDDGSPTSTTTTGNGGMGGSTTTGSGGMGGDSAGGAGGEGGCTFGEVGSCGNGMKCALLDEDAGPAGGTECIANGSRPAYVPCSNSDECEDGLFCNREWTVCQPLCNVGADCTSGGLCEAAFGPGSMEVPGVKTCGANCIPNSGFPCQQTYGPVACAQTVDDAWECVPGNDVPKGDPCSAGNDCAIGMGCFGSNPSVCRTFCTPASDTGVDASCPLAEACFTVLPESIFHRGTEFGICI